MTLAQAKAAAIAGGIPEDQITSSDLVAFGFDWQGALSDYTAPAAQQTDDEVTQQCALLAAAAKEGSLPPWMTGALTTVIGAALGLL